MGSHPHTSNVGRIGAPRVLREDGVSGRQWRAGGRADAAGVGGRGPAESLARALGLPVQGGGVGRGGRVRRPLLRSPRHLLLLLLLQDDLTQLLPLKERNGDHRGCGNRGLATARRCQCAYGGVSGLSVFRPAGRLRPRLFQYTKAAGSTPLRAHKRINPQTHD